MSQNTILLLCAGGLILGLIAVVIDRLNFPQRKFRPRSVRLEENERKGSRDRTGAHIVDFDPREKSNDESGTTLETSTTDEGDDSKRTPDGDQGGDQ